MMEPTAPGEIVTYEAEAIQQDTDESAGSDYYSDAASDLTSLSSSIRNYVFENGRRYHSYREGKYVLPNDETEKDRLDLVHHLFLLILRGSLHIAPLKNPQKVLDLGTGTGIWALDMADQYPSATVIGNDLSPIQPAFVAPNCQFIIEDIEEEWTYPVDHFDYIHTRTLMGSIKDWKELLANIYKHLKPGGWVELQEGTLTGASDDGSLKPDSYISKYFKIIHDAAAATGRLMNVEESFGPWMKEAGFINIKVEITRVPWGPWPKDKHMKEVGKFQYLNSMDAIDSYGLALMTRAAGYSTDEAKVFLARVRNEIKTKGLHAYNKVYVVYGQKPE